MLEGRGIRMELSYLAKRMVNTILIISVVLIVASVIYYRSLSFLPFMLGVTLGSFVSIAKVFLLERAVDKALSMEKKHAGNYIGLQHLLRLGLSAIALVMGALIPQLSLWGVAAGILAFQLATYNARFTSKS